jgi:hypothetical protein
MVALGGGEINLHCPRAMDSLTHTVIKTNSLRRAQRIRRRKNDTIDDLVCSNIDLFTGLGVALSIPVVLFTHNYTAPRGGCYRTVDLRQTQCGAPRRLGLRQPVHHMAQPVPSVQRRGGHSRWDPFLVKPLLCSWSQSGIDSVLPMPPQPQGAPAPCPPHAESGCPGARMLPPLPCPPHPPPGHSSATHR